MRLHIFRNTNDTEEEVRKKTKIQCIQKFWFFIYHCFCLFVCTFEGNLKINCTNLLQVYGAQYSREPCNKRLHSIFHYIIMYNGSRRHRRESRGQDYCILIFKFVISLNFTVEHVKIGEFAHGIGATGVPSRGTCRRILAVKFYEGANH